MHYLHTFSEKVTHISPKVDKICVNMRESDFSINQISPPGHHNFFAQCLLRSLSCTDKMHRHTQYSKQVVCATNKTA